jgi:hypothetical protein
MTQRPKERIGKWDYLKLQSFCTTKEMVIGLKRQPTEGEKNLCQLYIRQGINYQNIQELKKVNSKESMT